MAALTKVKKQEKREIELVTIPATAVLTDNSSASKENDSPNLVPVERAVKTLLGNVRLSKLKPRNLSNMAVQYQSLFEDYDGPAINIKLESENVEIECNPYRYIFAFSDTAAKIVFAGKFLFDFCRSTGNDR